MKKPYYQYLLIWSIPVLVGYVALGTFLDATTNAISLITPRIGVILSLLMIILWGLLFLYIRKRPLLWVLKDGTPVHLQRMGIKLNLGLVGMVCLLLTPLLVDIIQQARKQEPTGEESYLKAESQIGKTEEKSDQEGKIVIAVASFEGPSPQEYGIDRILFEKLEEVARKYQDIKLKRLPQVILTTDDARVQAGNVNASLILWGSYLVNKRRARLAVHFDLLHKPRYLSLREEKEVQYTTPADLEGFTVQGLLSSQMSYLALLALGLARYEAGDYDGAIARLTDALRETPLPKQVVEQASVYFYRGTSYYFKREFDRAISDFDQAIRLNPMLSLTYTNRAHAYKDKGNQKHAIQDFIKALEASPACAEALVGLGVISYETGDFDRAIESYSIAIAIRNDYVAAYNNRGNAYRANGEINKAIDDFNHAIEKAPNLAFAYTNRGIAYHDAGNLTQALADYTTSTKLDPNFAPAYYNRGKVYAQLNDFNKAIEDFSEAIRLEPSHAATYNERGLIFHYRAEFYRAIDDFSQAIRLQPNLPMPYNNRANSYKKVGNVEAAINDCTQCIKLAPHIALPYYNRGRLYQDNNRRDLAISDFRKVIDLGTHPTLSESATFLLRSLGQYK